MKAWRAGEAWWRQQLIVADDQRAGSKGQVVIWEGGDGLHPRCHAQEFVLYPEQDNPVKRIARKMAQMEFLFRKNTLTAAWKPRHQETLRLEVGVPEQCKVRAWLGWGSGNGRRRPVGEKFQKQD